jgi:omega-6 fatty acid desaturase / acyl-lipid omega-6 desaturase (Delta-12 desaturase)
MTQDQVFVPRTRSERGLSPLKPDGESLLGASISKEVMKELHEAIGDSPIGAVLGAGSYLVRTSEFVREGRNEYCPSSLVGPCT